MTSVPARPPSAEILVRTFHGHEGRLRSNLISTVQVFVDRRRFPFTVILDGESEADHALGERLSAQGLCDRVVYEPLPPDWKTLFQGVAFGAPYGRWGFDRQQWSTLYADRHADADVLGWVDSDSTFYSYLTQPSIFSDDGRLVLNVYRGSATSESAFVRQVIFNGGTGIYRNDTVALRAASPFECMYTNRMPIWFWRSTYENCRRHIAQQWHTDFDSAFMEFSKGPYSAFNILANYAIAHEPERYAVRLMDAIDGDVVAVGQNGCISRLDIVAGGLRTFGISASERLPAWVAEAHDDLCRDTIHLNRWARMTCGAAPGTEQADRHYATVHAELDRVPPDQRAAMRNAFLELVNEHLDQVELFHLPIYGTQIRVESDIRHRLRRHPTLRAAVLRVTSAVAHLNRAYRTSPARLS